MTDQNPLHAPKMPNSSKKAKLCSQAERIIDKFGGPKRLTVILAQVGKMRNLSSIYRWTYPREEGGTGGIVPTSMWPDILAAARMEGILITQDDMDVRSLWVREKDDE